MHVCMYSEKLSWITKNVFSYTVEVCVLIYFYIKFEMDSSVTALFLCYGLAVRTLIYEHTSCVKCLINSFIGFFFLLLASSLDIFIDSFHKIEYIFFFCLSPICHFEVPCILHTVCMLLSYNHFRIKFR